MPQPDAVRDSVEAAHEEVWRRFVNHHGILFDYVTPAGEVIVPTPAECAECRPNGLGWWCPIENGAFFGGLYLCALCDRWRSGDQRPEVSQRARRLVAGLRLLAEVGETPGFIARGVATDGRSHHPAGSDDQTLPWFLGLWAYLRCGLATTPEHTAILAQMVGVAEALAANRWAMPCDPPSFGNRGGFAGKSPVSVPRLLFVTWAMADLTGDQRWLELHQHLRAERPHGAATTRLEICSDGSLAVEHGRPEAGYFAFWTKASTQACLRVLHVHADDPAVRRHYAQGLGDFARVAAEQVGAYRRFSHDDPAAFTHDWRQLGPWWQPQATVADALAVAETQARAWHSTISPRKRVEAHQVHEPLFAAWIVALAGDEQLLAAVRDDIRVALCHYDWSRLNFSTFFAAEGAWFAGLPHGL